MDVSVYENYIDIDLFSQYIVMMDEGFSLKDLVWTKLMFYLPYYIINIRK